MRRIALTLSVLAAVVALGAVAAPASFPGRNGKIVVGWNAGGVVLDDVSGDEVNQTIVGIKLWDDDDDGLLYGCEDIYLKPTDDSCLGQHYRDPTFSPDGARVAFDAGAVLAVIGIKGEGFRTLPPRGADDDSPAFSPDGRRLVFTSGPATGPRDLWIGDDSGEDARRLVRRGSSPVWSARDWIAFVRAGSIYRIRPDGSRLRLIARAAGTPTWSPDGGRLAFHANRIRRDGRTLRRAAIYATAPDGHGRRRVSSGQGSVDDMVWSPDGRRLLVQTTFSLFAIDLSGRDVHDYGDASYAGAETVWETQGIDWQPLPR